MAATAISVDNLPSINPATGETLGYFEKTPPSLLPQLLQRARLAQTIWARVPMRERRERLRSLRDTILSSRDVLADAVVAESGKPRVEALFADIFVAVDTADFFAKNAGRDRHNQFLELPARNSSKPDYSRHRCRQCHHL